MSIYERVPLLPAAMDHYMELYQETSKFQKVLVEKIQAHATKMPTEVTLAIDRVYYCTELMGQNLFKILRCRQDNPEFQKLEYGVRLSIIAIHDMKPVLEFFNVAEFTPELARAFKLDDKI